MLQEHVPRRLRRVDADAVARDDRRGRRGDLELLGGVLEHGGEGGSLGDAEAVCFFFNDDGSRLKIRASNFSFVHSFLFSFL